MPKLPKGIFRRSNRPGYWTRDRRNGGDRWIALGSDLEVARCRLRESRGDVASGPSVTVKQAAAKWLAQYVATSRNARGQKLAEQRIERHLVPAMGGRPLSRVTSEMLRAYRLGLEARGLSPQSVAHVLSDVRCLLSWAVDEGWLLRSPCPRRLLPRIDERAPDRLEDHEVEKLVEMPEPWGFYLRLLLATGIRWGEAERAEASHVERGHLVLARTKTGKVRRVPLSPSILGELRGRVGRLVHIHRAQWLAIVARDLSGVARFHVNQTRHTYACRWLEAGGSIEALSVALGHTSIRTTQRYGRPNESAVQREAARGW